MTMVGLSLMFAIGGLAGCDEDDDGNIDAPDVDVDVTEPDVDVTVGD